MRNKALDYTALTIAIIGAVNWGLVGFFDFNLVAFLFGSMSWLSRIIYALVGPVSYTHLDVYKRQLSTSGPGCAPSWRSGCPWSYLQILPTGAPRCV